MLGVLAIIGVLSIGGISGYSKAMAKFRVNKTLDQISMLVMNIRTLYGNSIDYSGLNNKVALQMGIIPRDMLPSGQKDGASKGSEIINAYQGRVYVKVNNDVGGSGRSFTVEYTGLTREACVSIATADWGSQAGSGLYAIRIAKGDGDKTTEIEKPSAEYTLEDLPVPLSEAAKNCSDGTDIGNVVQWHYY